jgi:hypothetical protein
MTHCLKSVPHFFLTNPSKLRIYLCKIPIHIASSAGISPRPRESVFRTASSRNNPIKHVKMLTEEANSYCDHRSLESVNQTLHAATTKYETHNTVILKEPQQEKRQQYCTYIVWYILFKKKRLDKAYCVWLKLSFLWSFETNRCAEMHKLKQQVKI